MEFTITFLKIYATEIFLGAPLLLALVFTIVLIGQVVGWRESWSKFDALYWSLITATTVGYGDIRPSTRLSKMLSIVIALLGIVFAGIVVAIAVHSASSALQQHVDLEGVAAILQHVNESIHNIGSSGRIDVPST